MSKEKQVQQAFENAVHKYIDFVEKHPQADKLGAAAIARLVNIVDTHNVHPLYRSIHAKYSAIQREVRPPYQAGTPEKEMMDAMTKRYEAAYPPEKKIGQQGEVQAPQVVHKIDKGAEVNEKIRSMDVEIENKQKSVDQLQHDLDILTQSLNAVEVIENKMKANHANPLYQAKVSELSKNLEAFANDAEKQIKKKKGFLEYFWPPLHERRVEKEMYELAKARLIISDQIAGKEDFNANDIRTRIGGISKNMDPMNKAKHAFLQSIEDFDRDSKGKATSSGIDKRKKEIVAQRKDLEGKLTASSKDLELAKATREHFVKENVPSMELPPPSVKSNSNLR